MNFSDRLREEMGRQGLTVYGLARKIDAGNPWAAERNLYRWLSGDNLPSRASRESVARALGRPPDFFGKGPGHDTDAKVLRHLAHEFIERARELEAAEATA